MAKKHKNLENVLIQWDGDLSHPQAGDANQSIPASVDLGTWGGYKPVWYSDCYTGIYPFGFTQANCASGVMDDPVYFEDYDLNMDGEITSDDRHLWFHYEIVIQNHANRVDIFQEVHNFILGYNPMPPKAPRSTYTWGDVSFVIEIADGLGTGNRRAREARLQQLDKDKKKRLIRLICRVKGEEEVYDETKEVYPGDIKIKLDDVDMVISKVLGTMKVSTEWEEVPWDYGYDK